MILVNKVLSFEILKHFIAVYQIFFIECTNFLQLVELDLGQNLIETIAEDAFVTLRKLEVLYLDANKLSAVPSATTLQPISATLSKLNLGQNAIQTLEANVFLPLKNLR